MKSLFGPLYVLKNGIAVPEYDLKKWGESYGDFGNRRIALTEIHHCTVSTVFLALDHNMGNSEFPVLFETMVFTGEFSQDTADMKGMPFDDPKDGSPQEHWGDTRRYSFKCEALAGHHEVVGLIEKQFGQVQDKVSGLIYGIINAEEWTRETQ